MFHGLADLPPFAAYPGSRTENLALLRSSWVHIIPDPTWMYVAPHVAPPWAGDVGWSPKVSRSECIVVGRRHLRTSPSLVLYLDLVHEFCHLLQRRAGRDLWDMSKGYVRSPTELEAYRRAVREARRLGAPEKFLREYLRVEWVEEKDHQRLLRSLGVRASARPPARSG